MSISVNIANKNATIAVVAGSIDGGSANDNGYAEIRSGIRPDSPGDAVTGTLLATFQFSNPAFQTPAQGKAFANTISEDLEIDHTGRATWFRVYDRDGNAVIDGNVTLTGRGGDLEFDSVDFIAGGLVAINNLVLTV